MKTLNFVELIHSRKDVERKVIFTWSNVTKKEAKIICRNFIDGFVYAHPNKLRVDTKTYSCQQWRYHDTIGYKRWQFENGKHKIIEI